MRFRKEKAITADPNGAEVFHYTPISMIYLDDDSFDWVGVHELLYLEEILFFSHLFCSSWSPVQRHSITSITPTWMMIHELLSPACYIPAHFQLGCMFSFKNEISVEECCSGLWGFMFYSRWRDQISVRSPVLFYFWNQNPPWPKASTQLFAHTNNGDMSHRASGKKVIPSL